MLPQASAFSLFESCQKGGAGGGVCPVFTFNDLPAKPAMDLKKQMAQFQQRTGLLSPVVGAENTKSLSNMVSNMKPSEQSGLAANAGIDYIRNWIGFDPALPDYLTVYLHPMGQSAGLSFRMERKGVEMELGIHVHAPANQ